MPKLTELRNAKEVLPGKVKNKSVFPWQEGWDVGYAEAIDAYNNVRIEGDVEEMEKIAVEAMKKEAIRNGNKPHKHGFSKFCSCGICHTATIVSDALLEQIPTWLKVVKK